MDRHRLQRLDHKMIRAPFPGESDDLQVLLEVLLADNGADGQADLRIVLGPQARDVSYRPLDFR